MANAQDKEAAKILVDSMARLYDQFGQMANQEYLGQAAKIELAQVLMYLSASDGEIKWAEASFISYVCGINLTPDTMANFIRENDIYSVRFEKSVPAVFKVAVTLDNMIVANGLDIQDISALLIETYKGVGRALMQADNDVDDNENNDLFIYLDMLEDYANSNSDRRKKSVTGFTKNTGPVKVPPKSGVSAPQKR